MNTPKTRPRFHVYTFGVAFGASEPVGYGYWIDGSLSGGMLPNATPSEAELFALMAALRKLPEHSIILHHTTNMEVAKRLTGQKGMASTPNLTKLYEDYRQLVHQKGLDVREITAQRAEPKPVKPQVKKHTPAQIRRIAPEESDDEGLSEDEAFFLGLMMGGK